MIENQFSFKIKTFRSDGGVEFTSNDFRSYLSQHVLLIISLSLIHLSKMVLLKRKHRHIIETTVTLLSQASMPYHYWPFVAQIAVNLINMLPTSVLGWKSPWSKLYSSPPDLTQLKIFGCACYPNLRPYIAHKLEPRTKECIFIGYLTSSKGYLKEEVYMHQHPRYVDSAHLDYVCKLHKSLYGLKQAPRAWFERFAFHLLHLGFIASVADSSLFIFCSTNTIIYLLLYVDDIIVTGNDSTQVHNLIAALG